MLSQPPPPSAESPLAARALLALGAVAQGWHLFLSSREPRHYLPPGTITRGQWVGLFSLACVVLGGTLQVRVLKDMPRWHAFLKGGLVLMILFESLGLILGRGVWSLPGLDPRAFCVALAAAAMLL